jgi:hypothetical protein
MAAGRLVWVVGESVRGGDEMKNSVTCVGYSEILITLEEVEVNLVST